MEKDPLFKYYQKWLEDCLESARWLRSGQEYEDWMTQRGFRMNAPEKREEKAKEYEALAERYKKRLEEGEFGQSVG